MEKLDIPEQIDSFVVYELRLVNDLYYVGQTEQLRDRVNQHKSDGKYIKEVNILFGSESREVVKMAEAIYINAGWSNNINKCSEQKALKRAYAKTTMYEDGLIVDEDEAEEFNERLSNREKAFKKSLENARSLAIKLKTKDKVAKQALNQVYDRKLERDIELKAEELLHNRAKELHIITQKANLALTNVETENTMNDYIKEIEDFIENNIL